mmetsp:Transcript_104979/g.334224  ORF Transcript_104979/g.334224 Transcript_104979/m.334224 type:complete len:868 (-) Transcript_104979:39-2642(-)
MDDGLQRWRPRLDDVVAGRVRVVGVPLGLHEGVLAQDLGSAAVPGRLLRHLQGPAVDQSGRPEEQDAGDGDEDSHPVDLPRVLLDVSFHSRPVDGPLQAVAKGEGVVVVDLAGAALVGVGRVVAEVARAVVEDVRVRDAEEGAPVLLPVLHDVPLAGALGDADEAALSGALGVEVDEGAAPGEGPAVDRLAVPAEVPLVPPLLALREGVLEVGGLPGAHEALRAVLLRLLDGAHRLVRGQQRPAVEHEGGRYLVAVVPLAVLRELPGGERLRPVLSGGLPIEARLGAAEGVQDVHEGLVAPRGRAERHAVLAPVLHSAQFRGAAADETEIADERLRAEGAVLRLHVLAGAEGAVAPAEVSRGAAHVALVSWPVHERRRRVWRLAVVVVKVVGGAGEQLPDAQRGPAPVVANLVAHDALLGVDAVALAVARHVHASAPVEVVELARPVRDEKPILRHEPLLAPGVRAAEEELDAGWPGHGAVAQVHAGDPEVLHADGVEPGEHDHRPAGGAGALGDAVVGDEDPLTPRPAGGNDDAAAVVALQPEDVLPAADDVEEADPAHHDWPVEVLDPVAEAAHARPVRVEAVVLAREKLRPRRRVATRACRGQPRGLLRQDEPLRTESVAARKDEGALRHRHHEIAGVRAAVLKDHPGAAAALEVHELDGMRPSRQVAGAVDDGAGAAAGPVDAAVGLESPDAERLAALLGVPAVGVEALRALLAVLGVGVGGEARPLELAVLRVQRRLLVAAGDARAPAVAHGEASPVVCLNLEGVRARAPDHEGARPPGREVLLRLVAAPAVEHCVAANDLPGAALDAEVPALRVVHRHVSPRDARQQAVQDTDGAVDAAGGGQRGEDLRQQAVRPSTPWPK